jgi:hypothetical protein
MHLRREWRRRKRCGRSEDFFMGVLYIDNAISWAQYRVKGGWKMLAGVSVIYALAIIAGITLFYAMATLPQQKVQVLNSWTVGLLLLQTAMLGVFAATRVSAAIRQDVATRRIESHRMMPISPYQAIAGYLFGGSLQLIGLGVVNFVIGCVLCLFTALPMQNWVMSNIILGFFCIVLWALMALSAFVSRAIFWIILVIVVGGAWAGGTLYMLAPGLLVICSPTMGFTIFQFKTGFNDVTTAMFLGFLCQGCLILIFSFAAARKFVRDDALSMPVWSSLAVLLIWASASLFGLAHYDQLQMNVFRMNDVEDSARVTGTLICSILLALVAMASDAWRQIIHDRRRLAGANDRRPMPWLINLAACMALIMGVTFWLRPVGAFGQIVISTVVLNFLALMYFLMLALYPKIKRANVLLILFIGVFWLAPLLLDVIYYSVFRPDDQPAIDHFATASPLGVIVNLYTGSVPKAMFWGILFQALLMLLFALMTFRRRRALARAIAAANVLLDSRELPYARGVPRFPG